VYVSGVGDGVDGNVNVEIVCEAIRGIERRRTKYIVRNGAETVLSRTALTPHLLP
jgi:hypothetical protein